MAAPVPADDDRRVTSLRALGLLDTVPEERFDRITRTAQRLFGVEAAMVSLVDADRVWYKSARGFAVVESPRETSLCGHVVADGAPLVVEDTTLDNRFFDNPELCGSPPIRFYAGCPISGPDGSVIGTLCLFDYRPRAMAEEDLSSLADLAGMVEHEVAITELLVADELTGLANRRGFITMANRLLALCRRQEVDALVVYADVNGLKEVNDRFGHDTGDRLICHAASVMATAFRSSDVVGRLGGDEFAAVLTAHRGESMRAAERLADAIQAGNAALFDAPFSLSMAVGWSRFDHQAPFSLEVLLERADAAMYADKQSCRLTSAHR
jgi:diguanylate cyclase (GGDEF)-like protein